MATHSLWTQGPAALAVASENSMSGKANSIAEQPLSLGRSPTANEQQSRRTKPPAMTSGAVKQRRVSQNNSLNTRMGALKNAESPTEQPEQLSHTIFVLDIIFVLDFVLGVLRGVPRVLMPVLRLLKVCSARGLHDLNHSC